MGKSRVLDHGKLTTAWGPRFQPTHRHLKSGGLYKILYLAKIEADLTPAVVYMGEDGSVWVRPEDEFFDGRFQKIDI